MKVINKERTVTDTYYEAIDGTQFRTREECEKYDTTAGAVLRQRFLKLVIKKTTEYNFFGVGSDEDIVYAVKMETEADMNAVLQLYYTDNSWILNKEDDTANEYKERAFNMVNTAFTENDILFVGENYDGEIHLINTRANIIEDLQKIDRKEE